jgi:hypothetical protein
MKWTKSYSLNIALITLISEIVTKSEIISYLNLINKNFISHKNEVFFTFNPKLTVSLICFLKAILEMVFLNVS